jgi:hypothetical protein
MKEYTQTYIYNKDTGIPEYNNINEDDGELQQAYKEMALEALAENFKDIKKEEQLNSFGTGAVRFNSGKLRVDLIPPEAIEAYAEVMTFGANKYNDRNWEKGMPLNSSFIASALRHLYKWQKGEENDEETGLHHLAHMLWNVAGAVTMIRRGRDELDDRTE